MSLSTLYIKKKQPVNNKVITNDYNLWKQKGNKKTRLLPRKNQKYMLTKGLECCTMVFHSVIICPNVPFDPSMDILAQIMEAVK